MIPSLEGMEPVDYARYIAITLGFLVTSFSREKVFLRADVMFCVLMGVGWLCFPNVFLEFQVSGPRNPAHLLYARALGQGFLFMAVPILLNRRTHDDKVFTSIFLCRIMGFFMVLISLFYSHWKFSKSEVRLTARQFWFTGLAVIGWIFGNLRHLLVSGGAANSSVRPTPNRLWYHIIADLMLMLPATLYLMAFAPQTFVDLNIKVSPDDGFLSFASYSLASFGVCDCLYVLSAHSFEDTEAVKNIFKFRLAVSGPRNPAHLLYARALGQGFLFMAVPILLNRHTHDDKVFTSIFLCRIVGFFMVLISLFYSHWKFLQSDVCLTARQFWFTGLAVVGWIFGNLRHLLLSGGATNSSVRPTTNRLWYHILADLMLCLPASMYLIAFAPQTFGDLNIEVSPDDGFLAFVSYSHASFGICDCLYVLSAHSFEDIEAVKNVFKFRLAGVTFYAVLHTFHGLVQTSGMMQMLFLQGVLAINSLLALYYVNTSKVTHN